MADQKFKNTKNQDSELFKRLTKLFSGPIVNYNQPVQSRYRRNQMDKFGQKFTSAGGLEFKKSAYNPYENFSSKMMSNQNRADRYIDFDQMEYMPEIASALDIYADEMTTSNELNNMLNIKCPNEEIKSVLNTLFNKTLNLDSNLFNWCRNMCKYGDHFLYLDIDERLGIKSALGLPANQIERMEGKDPTNPNYVQFQWNSGGLTFENWQVAHFRILGNDKYSPYGTSVLDSARRIWRQLTLLEDAMMAYRITRSPERKVFYIDVGNIPPQEVEQYMQRVMTSMKRNQIVDQNTGRVDLRYNPMSVDEDYFIPVRGGQNNTKIDALPGGQFASAIEDVKYLRDKLFAALKVPMSYLIRGDGATEDKATLAQKDIRFARTIQRLQRVAVAELEKIGIIHLFTLGYRGSDLISFKLSLNNPSKIAALQELEHWKTKFDVAGGATEGYFSKRWIAQHIFGLSDEEFLRIQREQYYDRKFAASLEAAGAQPQQAAGGGGGGLGLGGGLGGPEAGGAEAGAPTPEGAPPEAGGAPETAPEGGGETPEASEAPPAAGEEGGSALLAAPSKRRDDKGKIMTTTTASKGKWYKPVANRGGDKRDVGARARSYKASGGGFTASPSRMNVMKDQELNSLIGNFLRENQINNNNEEEFELFRIERETRQLIESLESKNNGKNKA
jgi:hypothetical protein